MRAFSSVTELKIGSNGNKGIAGEIHLRDETRDEGVTEHREVDMGRPPGVVVIAPGIGAGLDGDEAVIALRVRLGAAGAGKIRIERRGMLIDDMHVTAAGIGLPQFDQRVRHAAAVFIEHMAVHDDAFADRLALALNGEVVIVLAHRLVAVDRPGQFRQRMPHRDQRLGGRALDRALVAGGQPRRMRRETLHWIDQCHDELLPRIARAARNCFAILSQAAPQIII